MKLTAHRHSTVWEVEADTIVNRELGVRARPDFRGDGNVFTMSHAPIEREPIGTVVICPPTHAEFGRDQRRELLTAWELAMRGFEVIRLDYRGSGHSSGDSESMSFGSMVHDVIGIAEASSVPVTLLGARVGALVAAEATGAIGGAGLVLWEPVLSGEAWFKEVFRASMMGNLKRGEKGLSGAALLEEFERTGHIDVVGNSIGWALYESLQGVSLARSLEAFAGDVLLVEIHQKAGNRSDFAALASTLRDRGATVTAAAVEHNVAWWFGAAPRDDTVLDTVDAPTAIVATVDHLAVVSEVR